MCFLLMVQKSKHMTFSVHFQNVLQSGLCTCFRHSIPNVGESDLSIENGLILRNTQSSLILFVDPVAVFPCAKFVSSP